MIIGSFVRPCTSVTLWRWVGFTTGKQHSMNGPHRSHPITVQITDQSNVHPSSIRTSRGWKYLPNERSVCVLLPGTD
uniref:Putative secreted protein n=1 Tax=Anopheles marajoara TaxID=58244 RepID=A0A2M4CCY2_9DIPT